MTQNRDHTLDASQSESDTFTWEPTETGEYELTVSSDDDEHTVFATVEAADATVSAPSAGVAAQPSVVEVTATEVIDTSVSVPNVSVGVTTHPVAVEALQVVEVNAPPASVSVTPSPVTTQMDRHTAVGVAAAHLTAQPGAVAVDSVEAAVFALKILNYDAPVEVGEPARIRYRITNVGYSAGETDVEFASD